METLTLMKIALVEPGARRQVWRRRIGLAASVLLFAAPVTAADAPVAADKPAEAEAPVSAVWMTQDIGFHFQSFTTFYSCRALEERVEAVLLALGADKRLSVKSSGCPNGELARLPYVQIHITSPVAATPEALAELEKSRSKRELTARVRGEALPDIAEQFPAQWKRVSLYRSKLYLEPGDCQLVEQLNRFVFPKLAVRVVKDNLNCMPNQVMNQPKLEVEALVALPPPDSAAEPHPAKTGEVKK